VKTDISQVRSLLVLELMTLQLFYNLQNHVSSHTTNEVTSSKVLLFSASNQDVMLRSMEGLLEVKSFLTHGDVVFKVCCFFIRTFTTYLNLLKLDRRGSWAKC